MSSLCELWSRLQKLAAPRALDDNVDGAANELHHLRIRLECVALSLEGGEVGIVSLGDELVCCSDGGRPERRFSPPASSRKLVELLSDLEVLREVAVPDLHDETSTNHPSLLY